jgi:hypothetical protein
VRGPWGAGASEGGGALGAPSVAPGAPRGGRILSGARVARPLDPSPPAASGAAPLPAGARAHHAAASRRRADEERRAAIVEAERRKLLAEAADLQGFLPRGVLRDGADAEVLRSAAAAARGARP